MTRPHDNLVGTKYSIKMGNTVPKDGVNLAYVGNTKQDKSFGMVNIIDNKNYTNVIKFEQKFHTYTDNILETSMYSNNISTDEILVTDKFMETADKTPLYYAYTCKYKIKKYVSVQTTYNGPDIIVTGISKAISSKEKYKIVLTPYNSTSSYITIYSNFISDKDNAFIVAYSKYDNNIVTNGYSELINFAPIYEKEIYTGGAWPGARVNKFRTEEISDPQAGIVFNVYVSGESYIPQPENVRNEIPFTYKIDALVDSKCLPGLYKTLNVGILQIEDKPSEVMGTAITSIISSVPYYLNVVNPHTNLKAISEREIWDPEIVVIPEYSTNKTIPEYWYLNWNMPKMYWYDYDLIIIAGAGVYAVTEDQKANIEDYLRHGGNIWIDNNGLNLDSILDISNFATTFSFEHLEQIHSVVEYTSIDYLNLLSRYATITPYALGYAENDNKLTISSLTATSFIARHDASNMQISEVKAAYETFESKGHIYYTATGVLTGAIYRKTDCISFLTNMFFRMAERKWYTTGDINATVLNKTSLLSVDYNSSAISMPYVNSYDIDGNSIALKKIIPNVFDKIKEYIPELSKNDTISFYLTKEGDGVSLFPVKSVYAKNDVISAYTLFETDRWTEAVNNENIDVVFPDRTIKYTIIGHYALDQDQEMYYPAIYTINNYSNSITRTISLSEKDGIYNAGFLNNLIPTSEEGWANNNLIYYEIRTGEYDNRGNFIAETPGINFTLYDNATGKNVISKDGTLTIAAYNITDTMTLKMQIDYYYKTIMTRFFSVKSKDDGIMLLAPEETEPTSQWHLKIRNGKYSQSIIKTYVDDELEHGMSTLYSYMPYEYDSQLFIPEEPYMYREEEIANFIDNNIVQVENIPMVVSESMPLRIVNRNKTTNNKNNEELTTTDNLTFTAVNSNWVSVKEISTNNIPNPDPNTYTINYTDGSITFNYIQSKVNASYSYVKDVELTYLDYDLNSGYIKLANQISYNDNILVSYYYEQDSYVYKGYVDNTHSMSLDLNPTLGHYSTFKTIDGGVISYEDIDSYKFINKTIYMIIKPYKEDSTVINTTTIMHVFSKEEADTILASIPGSILLGEVQIRTSSTADDLVVFDTRRRGGGIKEGLSHAQAEYYWDISDWNGTAYQKQGSAIVSIPEDTKTIYSESEIQDIVNKHIAYGVVGVVNYIDAAITELPATILIRNNVIEELDMHMMVPAIIDMTIEVVE